MCGIAGAYGKRWQYQPLDSLKHRGPDGQGVIETPNGYMAHTRLAIVDVVHGQQPMRDTADSAWLVCNGEIYNHPELRQRYRAYPYHTHSDSENILAAYTHYQEGVTSQVEGMYAFAVVDAKGLFLARDPLGIKPLYYGYDESGETLYYASEIKALQTVVAEVKEFPAGHWYSSQQGMVAYYDLQAVAEAGTHPTTPAEVCAALTRSVHSHLMSDVPLGVFLSGGLDSSIIAAIVAAELPDVHSFAVGMSGSADLANARLVAQHIGTTHHEYVYTEAEMVEVLPEVIYYLESFDPALVRSAVANYFLARMARQYVTVILSGEGADELYSGYSYLKQFDTPALLNRELLEITAELHNRNLQRLDRMTMAHGLEGRVPFLDRQFVEFSFSVPVEQKLKDGVEKWILRKAFEHLLPAEVVWRTKQKFAEGAGSAHIFQQIAAAEISDEIYCAEVEQAEAETGHRIRSKEELYYYRVFRRSYRASVVPLVGFSRSL